MVFVPDRVREVADDGYALTCWDLETTAVEGAGSSYIKEGWMGASPLGLLAIIDSSALISLP